MTEWAPDRGDIVWLNMNPRVGHEHSGRRPALVLSPRAYNEKVGLALVCPVTSQAKGYPFEVELPDDCPVAGVVLADQLRSVDWRARQAELACLAPRECVEEASGKAARLILR